jgi:copper(I)-binding protein
MQTTGTLRPMLRLNSRRSFDLGWACALAAALLICTTAAMAGSGLFVVNEPWIRPAPASAATDVYMNLRSSDGAALVGVRCDQSDTVSVEVPDSAHRGKFRAIERLPLPAGDTVRLAPGQAHLRLAGLRRAMKLGEHVALTLVLEAADGSTQEIPVNAEVRRRSPTDDEAHAHGHPGTAGHSH